LYTKLLKSYHNSTGACKHHTRPTKCKADNDLKAKVSTN